MAPSSANPYVELLHSDLDAGAVVQTDRFLGSPREQIESALLTYRLLMINHVKAELQKQASVTGGDLLRLLDAAGQLYLGRFNRMVGPTAAAAYVRAYKAADTGEVPMTMIYALADQHADRMGKYYNDTSRDALLQGFNRMVNKNIPARVAADRAMDAYGLTPRQMSGYIATEAAKQVQSASPRPLKARLLEYIGKSIRARTRIFSEQEVHNLDMQAQQTAWMWMQDKGKLSPNAEKVWLTAKDERVCPTCGPMHGKRVGITERFKMPDGYELYVPGAHPNCRCSIKITDRLVSIGKAVDFEEHEHRRSSDGRFTTKPKVAERPDYSAFQRFLDTAVETEPEAKPTMQADTKPTMSAGAARMMSNLMSSNRMRPDTMSTQQTMASSRMATQKPVMPTEMRIMTQLATQRVVMDEIRAEKAKQKKRRTYYRPTIKLEKPVFAIANAYDIDQHGKITLEEGTEFHADEGTVAMQATQYFHDNIESVVEGLHYNEDNKLTMQTKDGAILHSEIAEEDIWDVVSYVAYQNAADPDWRGGGQVRLSWYDEDGNGQFVEHVSFDEAAKHLGIGPEEFEVIILRLDEGHDSSLGHTHQIDAESEYGYETWITTGDYQTEYSKKSQVGHSAPLTFVDLIPDVETEEFGSHDD